MKVLQILDIKRLVGILFFVIIKISGGFSKKIRRKIIFTYSSELRLEHWMKPFE